TATLFHDTVDCGQAESGSLVLFLCGEKWVEHAGLCDRIHSVARVCYRQQDVGAGLDVRKQACGIRIDVDIAGFDEQLSTRRHGIARVDDQVQEHLFHLSGVGFDLSQGRSRLKGESDVLVNQALDELAQILDKNVEVQDCRLKHLATAER